MRLEVPSFLEAIMMAIGEVYSLPFHQGVMPLFEPSKFMLKYEINYADAMNRKHKDLHEITIEPIMLMTIEDGFNVHLRVMG